MDRDSATPSITHPHTWSSTENNNNNAYNINFSNGNVNNNNKNNSYSVRAVRDFLCISIEKDCGGGFLISWILFMTVLISMLYESL